MKQMCSKSLVTRGKLLKGLARPERFELPTYSSGGCRSIQLSYGRVVSVYIRTDKSRSEERFQTEQRKNRDLTFLNSTFTAYRNGHLVSQQASVSIVRARGRGHLHHYRRVPPWAALRSR